MQKHAGASGTRAGEMRSKGIPFLWGPTVGAGPTGGRQGGICREGCSAEQRWDMLEGNLLKAERFALQRFLQRGVRL